MPQIWCVLFYSCLCRNSLVRLYDNEPMTLSLLRVTPLVHLAKVLPELPAAPWVLRQSFFLRPALWFFFLYCRCQRLNIGLSVYHLGAPPLRCCPSSKICHKMQYVCQFYMPCTVAWRATSPGCLLTTGQAQTSISYISFHSLVQYNLYGTVTTLCSPRPQTMPHSGMLVCNLHQK